MPGLETASVGPARTPPPREYLQHEEITPTPKYKKVSGLDFIEGYVFKEYEQEILDSLVGDLVTALRLRGISASPVNGRPDITKEQMERYGTEEIKRQQQVVEWKKARWSSDNTPEAKEIGAAVEILIAGTSTKCYKLLPDDLIPKSVIEYFSSDEGRMLQPNELFASLTSEHDDLVYKSDLSITGDFTLCTVDAVTGQSKTKEREREPEDTRDETLGFSLPESKQNAVLHRNKEVPGLFHGYVKENGIYVPTDYIGNIAHLGVSLPGKGLSDTIAGISPTFPSTWEGLTPADKRIFWYLNRVLAESLETTRKTYPDEGALVERLRHIREIFGQSTQEQDIEEEADRALDQRDDCVEMLEVYFYYIDQYLASELHLPNRGRFYFPRPECLDKIL